ncbi:MAG TPA: nickel ABC transporter permease [Chloroflexota bacterium]|nr:nickel ABC transporter permease [Chloroflexota bacterium]
MGVDLRHLRRVDRGIATGRYIQQRLAQALLVIFGITLVVFFLARLTPGDPVDLMLPEDALPEQRVAMREALGLDKPLPIQYAIFLTNALHGNFGQSLYYKQPVFQIILENLPRTIELTVAAMLVSLLVAIPIGVLSAIRRDTVWDYVGTLIALLGQSIPGYFLGIILILTLSVDLHLFPSSGYASPKYLVLPALTLAAALMAIVMRLTRSAMLDVLGEDYIRTARAKGLAEQMVIIRHALKNTLIPLVTVIGLQLGQLLSGAVIIETVFGWSGVGLVIVQAIGARDYPVVQASVLFISVIFVFTNLAVDLLYAYLDPRIRYG